MIRLEHVSKKFQSNGKEIVAVDDANLTIEKGKILGVIGFSGAGKSTLVRCINLLEMPTDGSVYFEKENLVHLSKKDLRAYRQKIGMIFQQFNLLAQRTVLDNVCYPLEISGTDKKNARIRAQELLEIVGIADKADAYPTQLSGGQKQRVAIARALATKPEVLLCDEATSALDPITTRSILQLLKDINQSMGVTIVIITHEMSVVEQVCDKVAVMSAGQIVEQGTVKEVFMSPQSETARKLILPEHEGRMQEYAGNYIRIVFDGRSAYEPILSELILTCNTRLNILGANTEDIGGIAFGQMLIEKPEGEILERVRQFLNNKNIIFEEVGV